MNVLVTGGAGYIGSHTCVELLESGNRIMIKRKLFEEYLDRATVI